MVILGARVYLLNLGLGEDSILIVVRDQSESQQALHFYFDCSGTKFEYRASYVELKSRNTQAFAIRDDFLQSSFRQQIFLLICKFRSIVRR